MPTTLTNFAKGTIPYNVHLMIVRGSKRPNFTAIQ